MEKIVIENIDTSTAEKNVLSLIESEQIKTYFLNGVWGSGKTQFINNMEKLKETEKTKKKFIKLNLWELKDERTVINIAFDEFLGNCSIIIKGIMIASVAISILMTNVINIGLGTMLLKWNPFFYIIVKLFGIIALIVAVTQFFRIKSDQFYKLIFDKCTWITKNKVLIIDDFDRVSVDKQEEAYKLFNILHGKLPIVFLGDFSKITRNDDQYLQKIIDRQVELPHVLQSECIWEGYFSKVQDKFR